jgi:rfaE bifunctional protein nucleotidyltransferase chain/domain
MTIRVLCCGCFDLLHIGHVVHLQAAKALGDHLTVALTMDERVGKGPGRPLFPWREREHMLSSLRCVDCVVQHYDIGDTLRRIRPDIYVKGEEYEGALLEEGLCKDLGIEVVFSTARPVYHSTEIITGAMWRDRCAVR